ncbi:MAG: polysaccharide pyruvyl transferase CsaB [Phormidesmis sp. RL_2_1]|nr:polysaccharide pyruvyl transferase CsaB [Phormidesmis sp. RL_2_1]
MRALLCGYYGMGNGGDEALLAALLQMLPQQVTPVVLSGNPAETRDRYQVEAIPRKSLGSVIGALRRSDAFIWGGGSLMQDASSRLNPLYYGGLMLLAQAMGLKTIAWAQGIGPLNQPFSRWLTRRALANCDQVSVRDRTSEALLQQWHRPCLIAPDPVWGLAAEPVEGLWELPAPRVAVALRPHVHLTQSRLEIFAQALANFQKATGVCLVLVPFQPVKDLAVAQFIADHLSEQNSGSHYIYCLSQPQQLKGLFRGVEMTIGMRFHALVMSAAEGCRCFAMSYDPKVDAIARDLSLSGWTLSPTAATPTEPLTALPPMPDTANALCKTWLDFYANGDALTADQIQSQVDRAFMHKDLLVEALFS